MKTLKKLALICALMGSNQIWAQSVMITPEYDSPEKNVWSGAIYTGLDMQNTSGGIYLGLNGRYTMGKIATFSTNLNYDLTRLIKSGSFVTFDEELLNQLPAYKDFQFRGTFHFKDEIGTLKSKVKLGRKSEPNPTGTGSRTVKLSTQYESKVRNIYGLTASLNIQSRLAGNQDSFQVVKVLDNLGNDQGNINVGLGQNNLVLGAGLQIGQYTWFKGKFSSISSNFNKNRRIRKSLVANFEVLYALSISTGEEAYFKKDANSAIETYKITDVEKRRLGFRITTDYGMNKPGGFQRMELGWRPGVWAPSANSKFLNQAYVVYALGIAF